MTGVSAPDDPRFALARRLRSLRDGLNITQAQLAAALGASMPLISSWESAKAVPPEKRLETYATFFATKRSIAKLPPHVPSLSHFTEQERTRREELLRELITLRQAALGIEDAKVLAASLWHFPSDQNVTIVGSELPEELRQSVPYTDPDSPDHVEMYRYADLDVLFELYGHLRSVNPASRVTIRTASELTYDDYTTHLILLGGVDWNMVTAELQQRVELPVRQEGRDQESEVGGFEVIERSERHVFHPVLRQVEGKDVLVEDVAHFYRGPSPFNAKRTVTICNGQYQRGTFGAVRALTDPRFRDRNEEYVRSRFSGAKSFSLLFRVLVVNGKVVTPDWTQSDVRLHEWPTEED
jgi:transcriptional regulator with XRE-family HTH domain